jgi:hypothetical protein
MWVCHSGQRALALSVLVSYGHTLRHYLPVLKTDVMVITPILGRQSLVCDNRGHHTVYSIVLIK